MKQERVKSELERIERIELEKMTIREYKKSLDQDSKFFSQDVKAYRDYIAKMDISDLRQRYANLRYFNSEHFAAEIDRYEKKLLKAGMFDMGKLKPENALD